MGLLSTALSTAAALAGFLPSSIIGQAVFFFAITVIILIITELYAIISYYQYCLNQRNCTVERQPPKAKPSTNPNLSPFIQSFTSDNAKPISVNYHFTRKCNKTCGFCFHTEKTSYVASEEDMKRGLTLLKEAGMRKINFAGGEPFLYPKQLAMLCRFCKADLGLESVSIISNGTKITEKWLQQNGQYVDVLGVSCDSFDEHTNTLIGRGTGRNVDQLFAVRGWCAKLGIKFKLNTVVCSFNYAEDMAETVAQLDPFRWKCFQVLVVQDENDAAVGETVLDKRKRNAQRFIVTDKQFEAFCEKHRHLECFVPESNELMASSYLILDEYLCFLDKGDGKEKQSSCILKVGVEKALKEVRWDKEAFLSRGGLYDWSKEESGGCGTDIGKGLEW